jgi:SAM-dependent methyltransferase
MDRLENENKALKGELEKIIFLKETGSFDNSDIHDGIPVPPGVFRFWVAGTDNREWFLKSGKEGFLTLQNILGQNGLSIEDFGSILDFGCGCGRVLRHLEPFTSVRLLGTDINQTAVRWCDANISFAEFGTNNPEPPLRYHNDSIDLVYAFSVFTHMTEKLQSKWLKEIHRVLKTGGLFEDIGFFRKGATGNPSRDAYLFSKI